MRLSTANDILRVFENDSELIYIIETIASLNIPNWMLTAGVLRNYVWSIQHGYDEPLIEPNSDLDVIYFDKQNQNLSISDIVLDQLPNYSIDFTNQAYIHNYNHCYQDKPFTSAEEGLANSTETATAIGLTIESGKWILVCPWGVSDLLNLVLRMPPHIQNNHLYRELFQTRISDKQWLKKWPMLKVITPS
jgi:hypothetical protein